MFIVELTDACIRKYMYRYQRKMAVVLLYIFVLLFRKRIIFLDSKNLLFMHQESDLLLCSSDIFSSSFASTSIAVCPFSKMSFSALNQYDFYEYTPYI